MKNIQLTDISSLQNIDPSTIGGVHGLSITYNPNLSVCNLPNFCTYLSDVFNIRTISGNLANCLDEVAVTTACAVACPTSLDDFSFNTQQQIDDFGAMYAHCTNISLGNVTIFSGGVTNLDGLNNLANVEGEFKVYAHSAVTQISLPNLTTVGDFYVNTNNYLTTINLPNLASVEEALTISSNTGALTTINIPNLTSVGEIDISGNSLLTDLDLNGLTHSYPKMVHSRVDSSLFSEKEQ